MRQGLFAATALWLLSTTLPIHAEETFYCEVMSVEGTVTLSNATASGQAVSEGDLLSVDDVVSTGSSSYTDLAYDRDWNNVTRVEENSSIRIRSLYPTVVELTEGGVFAKLKSLPRESSFDVRTPTAIASVRGTEYRTTYTNGETQVYNVSDSDVYVYGFDPSGQQQSEPVVIRNTEKTFIQKRGDAPMAARRMEAQDITRAAKFQRGIEQQVMRNIDRGRVGKLPDVGTIANRMQEKRQQPAGLPDRRWKTGGDDPKNSGPGGNGIQEHGNQVERKQGMGQPQQGNQSQGKQQGKPSAGGGGRPQPKRQ